MDKFLAGKPFYITQPDTGVRVPAVWIVQVGQELVARWAINDATQRMHKYAAIPKDVKVWDDIIKPFCQRIEVIDKTDGVIYSIDVRRFDEKKWLLTTKSGPQWAVDRDAWTQT